MTRATDVTAHDRVAYRMLEAVPALDGGTRDRFYPDFVAELESGGWLVVEYKGRHLAGGDDTAEKTNIGLRWAEVSKGRGRFWMAEQSKAPDFRQRLAP